MTGLRHILLAALTAFCLWRGDRHITLAQSWRNRAFRLSRSSNREK
jgi:hypothetical protein